MKKKHPNSPYKRFTNALNILFQFYTFTYNTNNTITPKLVIEKNNFDKCTYGAVAPPVGGLIPIPKQHQHKIKPLGDFKEFELSDNDEPPPLIREPRIFNNNNNNNNNQGLIGFKIVAGL